MKTLKKLPAARPKANRLKNRSFISGRERLGSVTNYLMGNNNTEPKVGEGATELGWTDRYAYDVLWVSKDGKQCTIRPCKAIRTDNNGYFTESQSYRYEPNENALSKRLVYRNGSWRTEVSEFRWTEEAMKLSFEERQKFFEKGKVQLNRVIEGITYEKKTYPKINIIFGVRQEYRDPCF